MQYLLGQGPPEDSLSLEERLVTDGEFYNELLITEDDLIDQYLSGELSESEQESFENHFLATPERRRKVRFGRAFNKYVIAVEVVPDEDASSEDVLEGMLDVPKPPPKPWYYLFLPSQNPVLSYSLAAALLLIIATASWLALRKPIGPSRDPARILAVTLTPGLTRGESGGSNRLTIPADVGTVRLQLELAADEYQAYHAELLSSSGEAILSQNNLKSERINGRLIVPVDVAAGLIQAGDFRLKLSGINTSEKLESIGSYSFRSVSK